MPGIIFFIVFAVVILQILSRIGKKAQKNSGRQGNNIPSRKDLLSAEKEEKSSGSAVPTWTPAVEKSPFFMVRKSKLNGVWMESAGEMGLAFCRPDADDPMPSIKGKMEDFEVSVIISKRAEGGMETIYKAIYPQELPFDFLLGKADTNRCKCLLKDRKNIFFSDPELRAKLKDTSNDDICDRIFYAEEENILTDFLKADERADHLSWCMGALKNFMISDRNIILIFQGVDDEVTEVVSRLRLLLQLAKYFGKLSPEERMSLTALAAKIKEKPLKVTENTVKTFKPEIKKSVIPAVTPLPEKKKIFSSTPVPPIPPAQPVPAAVPAPPSVPELRPAPPESHTVKTEEITQQIPASAAPSSADLSVEVLAENLFGNAFAGDKEKEYFASVKGKKVIWKGMVKSAFSYSSDFVFGNQKGIKAKIFLMDYKRQGSLISSQINATISFPVEYEAFLRENTGKEIYFSGELFHFESISKEILLTNGKPENQ